MTELHATVRLPKNHHNVEVRVGVVDSQGGRVMTSTDVRSPQANWISGCSGTGPTAINAQLSEHALGATRQVAQDDDVTLIVELDEPFHTFPFSQLEVP